MSNVAEHAEAGGDVPLAEEADEPQLALRGQAVRGELRGREPGHLEHQARGEEAGQRGVPPPGEGGRLQRAPGAHR